MSMEKPTLPAARQFADEIRKLYAKGLEETELWGAIAAAMRKLLADPTLRERAQGWPATVESAPTVRNLLFYEDADYGLCSTPQSDSRTWSPTCMTMAMFGRSMG